jgi:FkbM family methyltransferase
VRCAPGDAADTLRDVSYFGIAGRLAPPRRRLQPLYRRVHSWAMAGMNYGDVHGVESERVSLRVARERSGSAPLVVFDVGANVGDYTQLVLNQEPNAQVHAFEPSSAAHAELIASIGGRAVVNRLALGAEAGTATLGASEPGATAASLHLGAAEHSESVPVDTLDAYTQRHGIGSIHLLKVDAEGSELMVLRGAAETIARGGIDVIQFEYGEPAREARVFFRDLYELLTPNFTVGRLLHDGYITIDPFEDRHEILVTTNYIALKR